MSKYKAKHADVSRTRVVIHPVHDMEKGIDGLNALRDEPLPEEITKEERMERLVAALGRFVDDEPEQLGRRGEETVWDVSAHHRVYDGRLMSRYCIRCLGNCSTHTNL